nr:hypothetical protein [Tanacetum cinerariifolium]
GELLPRAKKVIVGKMFIPTKRVSCEIENGQGNALVGRYSIIGEVILGLEYPIEWIGSIKCGKEYLRGSRLVLLWRNGWWRWWRWGQLSLFGICEHGGEIVYGIGSVCHDGGLCGDVSEEGGGQLDEGLDIGGVAVS